MKKRKISKEFLLAYRALGNKDIEVVSMDMGEEEVK